MSNAWRKIWTVATVVALTGCVDERGAPWADPPAGMCSECDQRTGALNGAEYGPADWQAAVNYSVADRGVGDIKVVVVHTVQGSYAGCISWFKNPAAQVSAHYVISKTGAITQMVKEKDIGWHVGSQNGYTLGIEHEGFVDDPNWVTEPMLNASAQLTCYMLKKYKLPADKSAVKGHVELPKQTHTDPGKYWPWDKYLEKIQACMGGNPVPPPVVGPAGCCSTIIAATGETILDDSGNDCIQKLGPATSWWTNNTSPSGGACGWGGSMSYTYTSADPTAENYARWRMTFAKAGNYKVEAFVPNNFASAVATYEIHHAGKVDKVKVDQKPLSDVWADLGTWDFAGNCDEYVYAADNTGQPYSKTITLGVDAVKVTAVAVAPTCPTSCDDGKACTDDGCQNGVCIHAPNTGAVCWDQDACTAGEKCNKGACGGGAIVKDCNDNNPCTADGCTAGTCTHTPNGMNCNDDNACTTDSCGSNGCSHVPTNAGCDDSNACTTGESCKAGTCAGGVAKLCGDDNPCTTDSCLGGACVFAQSLGACDDGDGCSVNDYCAQGLCLGGVAKDCDDGLPCSLDTCADGQCQHAGECGSGASDTVVATVDGGAAPSDVAVVKDGRSDTASLAQSNETGSALSSDSGSEVGAIGGGGNSASSSGCGAGHDQPGWFWVLLGLPLLVRFRRLRLA